MARLRTLYVGTRTVGDVREEQHILVLDDVTPDQLQNGFEAHEGFPPILAFGFDVDIPQGDEFDDSEPPTTVLLAGPGDDTAVDWSNSPPKGLSSNIRIIDAAHGFPRGLAFPNGVRVLRLQGYEQLPQATREITERELYRAVHKTS